jgi:hypothetical protein
VCVIRTVIAALIASLALAASVSADTTPICPPGEACDPPVGIVPKSPAPAPTPSVPATNVRGTLTGLSQVYLVFSRATGSTRIHAGSPFALHLAPGAYAIKLAIPKGRIIKPASVRVPSTGVIRLRLVVQPNP